MVARLASGADGYRPIRSSALPTWSGAVFGNDVYRGTPGKPALYQDLGSDPSSQGELGHVVLDNIEVTYRDGKPLKGYGMVVGDAESTDQGEVWQASSDKPLGVMANIPAKDGAPGCGGGLEGQGTTTVTCEGGAGGNGAIEVLAKAPRRVQVDFVNSSSTSRQGAAFAVLVSKVRLDKRVESFSRKGDSFGLKVTGDGRTVASGTTKNASGTTGTEAVGASTYTFSEQGRGRTRLSDYTSQWSCTRNGQADPKLSSGNQSSKKTTVPLGTEVDCTITNKVRPRLEITKKADPAGGRVRAGRTVNYTVKVANPTGANIKNAHVTDHLAKVLDDASLVRSSLRASSGKIKASGKNIEWTGNVNAHRTVTLHYSVRVNRVPTGNLRLDNKVTAPGSNCTPKSRSAKCATHHRIVVRDKK